MSGYARIDARGRLTVPGPIREALSITGGDRVHFRVDRDRAIMFPVADLIALAGSIPVPPSKRGMSWDKIRAETHRARLAAKA